MAASVNTDRSVRRSSGGVWRWLVRRFGALTVTMAALLSVSWISPRLSGTAPPVSPPTLAPQAARPAKSAEAALKPLDKPGWVDVAAPATPQRAHRRRPTVSAPHSGQIDGLEVLTADELDSISQAR
ncbi:MAG TPA: hypothetical protein VHC73_15520 [Vitreimonas sp.]|jgi:hypothetical protein|nr:hypothetical protein [Vitreimonas sp.]